MSKSKIKCTPIFFIADSQETVHKEFVLYGQMVNEHFNREVLEASERYHACDTNHQK